MKITPEEPSATAFATTDIRVLTKAVCTCLLEQGIPEGEVENIAYELDLTLVDDLRFGEKAASGRERMLREFGLISSPDGSGLHGAYRFLPGAAPVYVYLMAVETMWSYLGMSSKRHLYLEMYDCEELAASAALPTSDLNAAMADPDYNFDDILSEGGYDRNPHSKVVA